MTAKTLLRLGAAAVAALTLAVLAARPAAAAPPTADSDSTAPHAEIVERAPGRIEASPPATPMGPTEILELEKLAAQIGQIEELLANYADVIGTLAGHDVNGLLAEVYADTLAELASHGFDPGADDVEPGSGLGDDFLSALQGMLPARGSSGGPGAEFAAGWFVVAAVVVLLAGGGYIISDGVSRLPDGSGDGSGSPAADDGADPAKPGADDEGSAKDWDREADGWKETAEQSERQAGDENLTDEEREQAAKDAEFARQKEAEARKKAEQARQKKNETTLPGTEFGGGNPFAFRAWLLALHPWLEGSEIDRLGQFVEMAEAKSRGEDPRTVNPNPDADTRDDAGEVDPEDIDDPGIVDPPDEHAPAGPSKSQIDKLERVRPGPGQDIRVIYPNPEVEPQTEGHEGGLVPGGSDGIGGCEQC